MKKLLSMFVILFATGCSATGDFLAQNSSKGDAKALATQLKSGAVEDAALENLTFQMITIEGNENEAQITVDSPAVHTDYGEALIAPMALEFPEFATRFTFVLKSKVDRETVLVPTVTFFDGNLNELATIDNATFYKEGYFTMKETFDKDFTQAVRFLIVYSKEKDLAGKSEIVNLAREYELEKGNAVSEVTFKRLYAQHAPTGDIEIRIKDVFRSKKYVKNVQPRVQEQAKSVTPEQEPTVTPVIAEAPRILKDTEDFYLKQIADAIARGDDARALNLVQEATRAGSKKALPFYLEKVKK